MIAKALKQITDGLNGYLNSIYPATLNQAKITTVKNTSTSGDPEITVTLINIEEDKVYKNHLNPLSNRTSNSTDPIHPLGGIPTMRVNLYVLFAFNSKSEDNYPDALTRLTHVLRYFQSTPYQNISIPTATDPIEFTLEINYHNISLEDSNNMWSNLGGTQKPYAMYQIKMLEIEALPPSELVPVVAVGPVLTNPHSTNNTIQNL